MASTALLLVRRLSNFGDGNAFKDFPGKKVSLLLCHALGDEVSIDAQTKRCLRIARRLGLNHDIAQHRSTVGSLGLLAARSSASSPSTAPRGSRNDAIATLSRSTAIYAEIHRPDPLEDSQKAAGVRS